MASDFAYAFGVMLYEALFGRLPHRAATFTTKKRGLEQPSVCRLRMRESRMVPIVSLCGTLLSSVPSERPTFEEIALSFASLCFEEPLGRGQLSEPLLDGLKSLTETGRPSPQLRVAHGFAESGQHRRQLVP